jgi:metal-responsive CopG/Arc/MetJ family transcriptional regulator
MPPTRGRPRKNRKARYAVVSLYVKDESVLEAVDEIVDHRWKNGVNSRSALIMCVLERFLIRKKLLNEDGSLPTKSKRQKRIEALSIPIGIVHDKEA